MAWHLDGTYFENCNCDVLCPCSASSLTLPADNERCLVVFAIHVDSGEIEGTDVSGLTALLVADTPGKMMDGNWRMGVIMDANASPQQGELLGAVLSGQKGGPMENFAPLIGENLGLESAPIEYSNGGVRHSVKAGDFVQIEVEDIVPEALGEPTRLMGIAHPVNTTLTVAQAKSSRVNVFGLDFDNTGKNGHAAPFSWAA